MPTFSGTIIPNNTSEASAVKMSKLQSILSTSLPSRGIPTVINMNGNQTSPTLPPLQQVQQVQQALSLSSKTSNNIPLPMEVVSKLACSLPTSASNGAINGGSGMILSQTQQQGIHQIPS